MARITLGAVQNFVHSILTAEHCATLSGDDAFNDIRLISDEDQDEWTINIGSSDYDQWHGAACGASSWDMTQRPTKKYAKEIARDLLDQVLDQLAQSQYRRN